MTKKEKYHFYRETKIEYYEKQTVVLILSMSDKNYLTRR